MPVKKSTTSRKKSSTKSSATKTVRSATKTPVRKPKSRRQRIVLQTDYEDMPRLGRGGTHLSLYRNIALGFFIITIVLFASIFFTSVRRATVKVSYVPEVFRYADVVQLSSERLNENTIAGMIEVQDVMLGKTFSPKGTETTEELVIGKIKIVNNSTKDQPLVKTTRFLSEKGKLFRLSQGVVIKAGEELADVEVYADEIGDEYEIKPTQFTIPGLWEPLQEKIYGVSEEKFKGGKVERGIVSPEDMQKAEEELREAINEHVDELVSSNKSETSSQFNKHFVTLDSLSIDTTAAVGDSVSEFTLTANTNAVIVRYNDEELRELTKNKIETQETLAEYVELQYDPEDITVRVESYDLETGSAQLSLFTEVEKHLKEDAEVFDEKYYLGKSEPEISSQLQDLQGVNNVEISVEFFPKWVETVPSVGGAVGVKVKAIEVKE